jgi:hypothetical protein
MDKKIKLIILGILAVVVVIVGVMIVRPWLQNRTVAVTTNETILRPELNISFSFPSGEEAYTYIEPPLDKATTTGGPIAAFIMMRTQAYMEFQSAEYARETPPSMSLFVFNKPEESATSVASGTPDVDRTTRLRDWTVAHDSLTSYSLAKGVPEEVDIDGVKALHYQTDGLYLQEVYVAFNRGKYYLIVGQYDGEADPQRTVFQELVKSITFM